MNAPPLTVDEQQLHTLTACICVALCSVAAVRFGLTIVVNVSDRFIRREVQLFLCTLVVLAVGIMTSSQCNLTISFVIASISAAAACATSRQSLVVAFTVCFATLCVPLIPLLGEKLKLTYPPYFSYWVIPYRGAQALLTGLTGRPDDLTMQLAALPGSVALWNFADAVSRAFEPSSHARHLKKTSPSLVNDRNFYVYFDAVSIISTPSPEEGTVGDHSRMSVFSVGDGTHVRSADGFFNESVAFTHLTLLGSRNRITDTVVRCHLSNVTTASCLQLSGDTEVNHLRVEVIPFQQGSNESAKERIVLDDSIAFYVSYAKSCVDLRDYIASQIGMQSPELSASIVQCVNSSTGAGMISAVDGKKALMPHKFSIHVPYLVRLQWYTPGVIQNVRDGVTYLSQDVMVPFLAFAERALTGIAVWSSEHAAQLIEVSGPYLQSFAKALRSIFEGVSHEVRMEWNHGQCASLYIGNRCNDSTYVSAARVTHVALDCYHATSDALELVPGVSSVFLWAWNAEWKATAVCVSFVWNAVRVAVPRVLVPLARIGEYVAIHNVLPVASRVGVTLASALRPGLLFGVEIIVNVWSVAWKSERRWLAFEWACTRAALAQLSRVSLFTLHSAWRTVEVVYGVVSYATRLYWRTSLSVQLFIFGMQTTLLLIVLRNDVRYASAVQPQGSPFILSFPGVSYLTAVATAVKVHSYAALVYVAGHFTVLVMLVGLSVIPFMAKLKRLTLFIGFPVVSSHSFLLFFYDQPSPRHVGAMSVVKALLAVIIDYTAGDIISYVVRELIIFLGIMLVAVVVLLIVKYRSTLPEKIQSSLTTAAAIATAAVANSTPSRPSNPPSPYPSQARPGSTRHGDDEGEMKPTETAGDTSEENRVDHMEEASPSASRTLNAEFNST